MEAIENAEARSKVNELEDDFFQMVSHWLINQCLLTAPVLNSIHPNIHEG